MKTAYPVLQSGFLATSEKGLTKTPQPAEEKIIKAIELGKPFDANGNPFFYDADLETLFNDFNNDHRKVKSFEFREQFLVAFKKAIGCYNFREWLFLQEESPYLTQMHRRFLNDTLNFIFSGERDINIESWMGLVYPRVAAQSDMSVKVLSDTWQREILETMSLGTVIAHWTSQSNGWNDLICFAGIVFTMQTSKAV